MEARRRESDTVMQGKEILPCIHIQNMHALPQCPSCCCWIILKDAAWAQHAACKSKYGTSSVCSVANEFRIYQVDHVRLLHEIDCSSCIIKGNELMGCSNRTCHYSLILHQVRRYVGWQWVCFCINAEYNSWNICRIYCLRHAVFTKEGLDASFAYAQCMQGYQPWVSPTPTYVECHLPEFCVSSGDKELSTLLLSKVVLSMVTFQ